MKIIMLGAPGAGKGTQTKRIMKKYAIPRISTGDILRNEVKRKTDIGEAVKNYINDGKLAPDDIVINIVKNLLKKADYTDSYILDGFPRTLIQATELDKIDTITVVLYITVPFDKLVKRLSGRRICSKCGKLYNLVFVPPKKEGICDFCDDKLIQRKDDKEEIVSKRIKIYQNQTTPLINYYKKKNLIRKINGLGKIEDIFNRIINILDENK